MPAWATTAASAVLVGAALAGVIVLSFTQRRAFHYRRLSWFFKQPAIYGLFVLNFAIITLLYLVVPRVSPAVCALLGGNGEVVCGSLPTDPNSAGVLGALVYVALAMFLLFRGDQLGLAKRLRKIVVAAFEEQLQLRVSLEDQDKSRRALKQFLLAVPDGQTQVRAVQIAFFSLQFSTDSVRDHAVGRYDRLYRDFLGHNPPENGKFVVAMIGLISRHTRSTDELIGILENSSHMPPP